MLKLLTVFTVMLIITAALQVYVMPKIFGPIIREVKNYVETGRR